MADEIVAPEEGLAPDAFDLAFEAASGTEHIELPVEKPVEPSPAAEKKEEPPAAEKHTEEKPVEPPLAAEKPAVDPVKAAAEKIIADKVEADRQAEEAKAEAKRKEAAEKAAAEQAAQEQFSAEEQEAIAYNAKNFPETHKAYEAKERVLVVKLTNMFKSEIAAVRAELGQQIAPVASTIAANSFESAVLRVHPDAFDVLPSIDTWIATKPAFMQQRINDILDKGIGGPQATNEVLTLFKAETASSAQTPGTSADDQAAATAAAEKLAVDKAAKEQSGNESSNDSQTNRNCYYLPG